MVGDTSSSDYFSHGIKPSVLSSASMGKYYFSLVGLIVSSTSVKVVGDIFLLSSILVLVVIDLRCYIIVPSSACKFIKTGRQNMQNEIITIFINMKNYYNVQKRSFNKPIQKRGCRSSTNIRSTDKLTVRRLLNSSSKSLQSLPHCCSY